MSFFTAKKALALGIIVVLLISIPVVIYFLQQQQQTQSKASKATTVSICATNLTPCNPEVSATTGQTFTVDVNMDPGTNQVMAATLDVTFDKDKLATASGTCGSSICSTGAFPSVLEAPIYTSGKIIYTLSIGTDVTKTIQTPTKIATITFRALASTDISGTKIEFGPETNITSSLTTDTEKNVLSAANPAKVVIAAGPTTPTPTSPVASPSANQSPICTSLNVDRVTSGPAPFSITFTANGNDPDGTINKVTFDFGDGPVKDETQGSGIGTKTVSTPTAHTYNNPGTYKASATLTDNNLGISNPALCTQTITVTEASTPTSSGSGGTGTGGNGGQTLWTPTPTPTPTVGIREPISSPGPEGKLLWVGAGGAILSILGALIFFAL